MTPGTPPTTAAAHPAVPAASGAPARRGLSWPVMIGIALVLMLLVRGFVVQSFYVPTGSMEPTVEPGDRILVNKLAGASDLHRGDVVVFDGTSTFAVADRTPVQAHGVVGRALSGAASLFSIHLGEQDYLKRIVGMPGDRVACCDAKGRITVNGTSVEEAYLAPGAKPSEVTFAVTVPAGRIWLMGDNRSDSADSRSHLGDPGGGMVPLDDVIGRALVTYWPLSRLGTPVAATGLRAVPPAGATR